MSKHVTPSQLTAGSQVYLFPCEDCGYWMVEVIATGAKLSAVNIEPSPWSVECHGSHVCAVLQDLNPGCMVDWFPTRQEWDDSAIEPSNGKISEECGYCLRLTDKSTPSPISPVSEWSALESLFTPEGCADFMYMGTADANGKTIWLYKNCTTRRYLNLDAKGDAYEYTTSGYVPTSVSDAVVWVSL